MRLYLPLFVVVLLTACESPSPSTDNSSLPGRIQPWQQDSTYWSWDGKEPVLLLGAGMLENIFLGASWETQLRILEQSGGNYIELTLNPEDLNKESYMDSLTAFLKTAGQERIAVAVQIDHDDDAARDWSAHFDKLPNVIPSKHRTYWPKEKGQEHWFELLVYKENAAIKGIPLVIPEVLDHGEIAAEGIAGFNRSVLAGAAAVRHAPLPRGDGFTAPALASIRAVRTVEHLLKFWDLRPAPEIIPGAEPNSVYAATDDKNGYLLYLPTAGSVGLQLDINPQVPLRVTVIGYLGTQKSEILRPPYNSSFTLYSEEPRGGWMVIKPL